MFTKKRKGKQARKKGMKAQFLPQCFFNQMCSRVRDKVRSVASEQSPIAKAVSCKQSITVTDLGHQEREREKNHAG